MSQEIGNFLADSLLKPIGEGQGQQHGRYADDSCRDRQPDDKPWEGTLPVKGDAPGYKSCYIQMGCY